MFTIMRQNHGIPLPNGELLLVGRGRHCDIQLDDPSASRVHCRLLARDGKVRLTDAGSRWGTFVNGTRVAECELMPGDQITIGETVLTLDAEGTPHETTLARKSQLQRGELRSLHSLAAIVAERDDVTPAGNSAATPAAIAGKPLDEVRFLGKPFAGYHLCELIERTPSGLLFLATGATGTVALKLFHPATFRDEPSRQRFARGIDVVRGLRHPNLVSLHAGGMCEGVFFTASEYVEGESAAEMIHRIGIAGMLDWRTTLRIAVDLAKGLEFIEEQKILHRSIQPRHILVPESGAGAKLSDMLLAKELNGDGAFVTRAGETVGEMSYLSPEQITDDRNVDHRSDIYQLGATLYALLTGKPPCSGSNPARIIDSILTETPIPPTKVHLSIPALFEGLVLTMLEKDPKNRFQSAKELLASLRRVEKYAP